MASRLLNQTELAEILDVSKATITMWAREYGMPVAVKGKRGQTNGYELAAIFRWYGSWQVDKVLAKGATNSDGQIIDGKQEEARLKKHQADKAEVEAQKAREEVLLIEDVKDILSEIAVTFGSQLDALGGRLANELAAIDEPAEIRQRLFAEGRRIREQTADALESLASQASERDFDIGESTAAENSG